MRRVPWPCTLIKAVRENPSGHKSQFGNWPYYLPVPKVVADVGKLVADVDHRTDPPLQFPNGGFLSPQQSPPHNFPIVPRHSRNRTRVSKMTVVRIPLSGSKIGDLCPPGQKNPQFGNRPEISSIKGGGGGWHKASVLAGGGGAGLQSFTPQGEVILTATIGEMNHKGAVGCGLVLPV